MASFHFILFFLFSFFISASANLHKTKSLFHKSSNDLYDSQLLTASLSDTPPTRYFEVTRPINHPKSKPCSHRILNHDFAYILGRPPVTANYTRPTHCSTREFSSIVLELKAMCKGRQFDRIFRVWLGGVKLLRSCTIEPRATGIERSVKKDITRYHSLLLKKKTQTFAVFMGNAVDETYTGVYHVDITMHFL